MIAIGRNEGARLIACLDAMSASTRAPDHVVYVDSGSTDGSVAEAEARGAKVVLLDTDVPFTAARARNAGFAALTGQGVDLVQFIDGDCALDPDWLAKAESFLAENAEIAVVCGRRRERFPEASIYNQLCDWEWDTPPGAAKACGGDALMRADAFTAVEGFDGTLIAGEEPELCVRLRQAGWKIWRLDAEMTLHDAAMTRFSQFWKRARRAGHAFAEGAALHGAPPERHWVKERNSACVWGVGLPVLSVLGAVLVSPWLLALLLIYPAQMARMARSMPTPRAVFLVVGKIAEARGVAEYFWRRMAGRRTTLIEYK